MYQQFWSQVALMQKGLDLLPRGDLCGIHIPAGWIIKIFKNQRCNNTTQIKWQRRYTVIANRYIEANFSLTGEDGADNIEVVDVFKYLGQPLDYSYDDWPEFLRNTRKTRQVWSHLGKLLQRDEADPFVLVKFYRKVVQVLLLFEAETWSLLAAMSNNLRSYMWVSYCMWRVRRQ